jgi:hypothetical protein
MQILIIQDKHVHAVGCALTTVDLGEQRVVLAYEAEDAIAERDGKIRELEAMVARLKNCWNCDKAEARCHYFEGPCCERWEIEK